MTIYEIRRTLNQRTTKSGSVLCRPMNGYHFFEIPFREIEEILDEIERKLPLVITGVEKFSKCEVFAFRQICEFAGEKYD